MKNLFCGLFFIFCSALIAQAGCFTGAACSIDGLKNKQYADAIENYFAKNIMEPDFVNGLNSVAFYNELFLFNTIV